MKTDMKVEHGALQRALQGALLFRHKFTGRNIEHVAIHCGSDKVTILHQGAARGQVVDLSTADRKKYSCI